MKNFITVSTSERKRVQLPAVDLSQLPAKLSKRLWIEPGEMVRCVQALELAEWAIEVKPAATGIARSHTARTQNGISREQYFSHGVDSSGMADEL